MRGVGRQHTLAGKRYSLTHGCCRRHCFCCAAGSIVYFGENINSMAGQHWQSFATQDYFDEHGVFYNAVVSGPALFTLLVVLVREACMQLLGCRAMPACTALWCGCCVCAGLLGAAIAEAKASSRTADLGGSGGVAGQHRNPPAAQTPRMHHTLLATSFCCQGLHVTTWPSLCLY
jgi:hypothetical protein